MPAALADGRVAAVAAAVIALAGCGHSTAKTNPSATPPVSSAPAATASQPVAGGPARQALAAYTGMWAEMQAAGVTADWTDPRLARYASGAALRTLVAGLRGDHEHGIVIKGRLVIHPQVISQAPRANPTQVVIRDCSDDSHWLNYIAATGRLQNNVPGGHRLVEALATVASGHWTISRLAVHAEGTC